MSTVKVKLQRKLHVLCQTQGVVVSRHTCYNWYKSFGSKKQFSSGGHKVLNYDNLRYYDNLTYRQILKQNVQSLVVLKKQS